MSPRPDRHAPGAGGSAELLDGLLAFLREEDAGAAVERGLTLLAHHTDAQAVALLRVEAGQVVSEAWWPSGPEAQARFREPFLRDALAVGANGSVAPGEADARCRAVPVTHHERTVGAVCFGFADVEVAERFDTLPEPSRLVRLLGQHEALLRQIGGFRAVRSQYERWFKRLDDQLRVLDRERQKFAAVVSQTDTYVYVADSEGTIRWANKAMSRLVPAGPESFSWIGQSCRAVCARLSEGSLGDACRECPVRQGLAEGEVGHRELQQVSGGSIRTYYLTTLPIKNPDGRAEEILVLIQDLSDLDSVRRSESRYRLVFERSANAIVMADPETHRILLANAMASRLTGYTRDELQGFTLRDLHPAAEWQRIEPFYSATLVGGTPTASECLVAARGHQTRVASFSTLRFELDGREVLMVEFRDVTDRKRAEEALQKAELRLRAVVANLPVVLFAIDAKGIFTLSEGKALASLGLRPGEVVGKSVYDTYRDSPEIREHVRRALDGDEFEALVSVGTFQFETRYTPLRDAQGRVVGLIGVASDVTDRRRLEDQLRHAQKLEAVGRLAGGVAHDFNNLLTAILGQCELLLRRAPAGEPSRKHAEEIHKAGVRGAMLTRQLLAFSRRDLVISKVLDLRGVVIEMEGMLRRLIGEDVELATRVDVTPAWVRMDPGHLEQVLMNLAVNARDAMPRGGRLSIAVTSPPGPGSAMGSGPAVLLEVTDTGVGMDVDVQQHLFEPFFTTKEPGKGTGLGLSIVYGIVLQNGGDIQVESRPGAGTTVRVFLPRAEEAVHPHEERPGLSSLTRGNETILLAEDDAAVRPVVREILEVNGYTVLEASGGAEALALAERHAGAIHLLLTDVVMPQMSGGELAQRLSGQRPEMRILYMSGNNEDALVRHGVTRAGVAFLQKPFALEVLAQKVREVLESPVRRVDLYGPGVQRRPEEKGRAA